MKWKDGKIVKVVIRSTLGGNLRLRVPNKMKDGKGVALKQATGDNKNPFYAIEKVADPVISDKAIITLPELKNTFQYDIPTIRGQVITLFSN